MSSDFRSSQREADQSRDALYRTQMAVSTAVFFDDVAAAIVAGAMALSGAQRGALWLREAEILNLSMTLGDLSANASANAVTDEQMIESLNRQMNRQNPDSRLESATKGADHHPAETETWICVLRHTVTSTGAASVQRHDQYVTNHQAKDVENAENQSVENQGADTRTATQIRSAPPAPLTRDAPLTRAVQNAIRGVHTDLRRVPTADEENFHSKDASRENANGTSGSSESANSENGSSENADDCDVAFPLLKNGRVIGVLQIGWNEDLVGELDNRVLELFCDHAAVGLANARLFEQLESAKSEWETTFDGMIDGVCIERPDGTILRANHVATRLFNRTYVQMPGSTRQELHAQLPSYEELRALAPVAGDVTGRDVRSSEFRFGTPPRIILETVFALPVPSNTQRRSRPLTRGADHRRMVRILRDVTEQRRLEEQLIQSEKLAALGELISGVAHELNNPLTTVTGYSQLLQEDLSIPASARRQIEHIYEDASRAARIVSNLLAFVRREDTRRDLIDVNQALRGLGEMLAYQMQAENVRLAFEYSNDLPPVAGDLHQLQQVFLNVINNAQQALHAWRGGGTISLETKSVPVGGVPGVLVSIRDNGPGIAPDHLRRLFDPFWTTKSAGEGTGLGMSISLGIVSRHGGRIWAESTLGHGAQFYIELPGSSTTERPQPESLLDFLSQPSSTRLAADALPEANAEQANAEQANADEAAAEADEESTTGAQILVVDDEEPVIFLMSEILGLDDHEITPAFNGGEALALLQERDFDLIISDVRMPAVGGPTFFEILQTTRPDLLPRVVFVTGDTMSRSTQEFLRKAGRPMLAKPFNADRLRALVREQLEKNR